MVRRWIGLLPLAIALAGPANAQHTPTMRELIELTDLSSLAISPDGRMVAFREESASIERNAYDLAWFVVPVDGSAPPRRLADAGEGNWLNGTLLSEPPLWSADSQFIVYRAVIDGEVQVWRAAADGSSATRVTQEPGNVIDIAPGPDSQSILFRVGAARADIARAERQEYDEGVLVDASVDPSRPLYRGARIDGRRATERLKGFWFGHGGLLADRPPRARVLDVASGRVRDASDAEAAGLAPPAQFFDRLDGRLMIARAAAGDARGTGLADAVHCNPEQCAGQRIRSVAWQRGADSLVFETRDGNGNSSLYRWDVGSGSITTLATGQGVLNGGRDESEGCAIGARTIVCVAAAADAPPRLVAIDLDTGNLRTLVEPNSALADPSIRFRPLEWHDSAGRRFTGQLLRPAGAGARVPLFVTYYSCSGYLRGGLGDEFPLREFARNGIAALCINRFPAPDGIGDQVGAYRIAQSGVAAAIALLVREDIVDPAKVGMGGVSFGGESTIWIAMHSRLLAAMSIANVLLTPTYYWFNARPRGHRRSRQGGHGRRQLRRRIHHLDRYAFAPARRDVDRQRAADADLLLVQCGRGSRGAGCAALGLGHRRPRPGSARLARAVPRLQRRQDPDPAADAAARARVSSQRRTARASSARRHAGRALGFSRRGSCQMAAAPPIGRECSQSRLVPVLASRRDRS